MSDTPAEVIKDLLVTAEIGIFGTDLYVGRLPDLPDACVVCYDTGGESPNPRFLLDYPQVMVKVRGTETGYSAGWLKAKAVKDALLGLPSQDIGSERWVSLSMMGDINFLGYEDKKRPVFSLNFRIIKEPASGTHREVV